MLIISSYRRMISQVQTILWQSSWIKYCFIVYRLSFILIFNNKQSISIITLVYIRSIWIVCYSELVSLYGFAIVINFIKSEIESIKRLWKIVSKWFIDKKKCRRFVTLFCNKELNRCDHFSALTRLYLGSKLITICVKKRNVWICIIIKSWEEIIEWKDNFQLKLNKPFWSIINKMTYASM